MTDDVIQRGLSAVATIVFAPDPDLGPDPLDDTARSPRRLGELIDLDRQDAVIIWREWGDQFPDGVRTHIVSSGAWEHVTVDRFLEALDLIEALDGGDGPS